MKTRRIFRLEYDAETSDIIPTRVRCPIYQRPQPSFPPPSSSISKLLCLSQWRFHIFPCMSSVLDWHSLSCKMEAFDKRGPGRPRWDRRSNTVTHASLRACGAQLGGSVWKQGKWQNPLKIMIFQRDFVVSPVSRHFPYSKMSRNKKMTKSLENK